jgi:hypothetical protein
MLPGDSAAGGLDIRFPLRAERMLRLFFFNLCGGTLGIAATTGILYQAYYPGRMK